MASVPHVTSGSGLRKFQADGFFMDKPYKHLKDALKHLNVAVLFQIT